MENQNSVSFHVIHSTNSVHIDLITNWYLSEWNIAKEITIQNHAKSLGMEQIHLFTHTAENLYIKLAWEPVERIALGAKDIVIMRKQL